MDVRELDHKESWVLKNWWFWTVGWRRLLRVPCTARRSNSPPKGDQSWVFIGRTDVEAESPILWPPGEKNWFIWKDPDARKDWRCEEKGMTEDKMVAWHHRLNGQEFEQAPGVGDGQGSLVLCSPWGSQRVGHDWATELNWFLFVLEDIPKHALRGHMGRSRQSVQIERGRIDLSMCLY